MFTVASINVKAKGFSLLECLIVLMIVGFVSILGFKSNNIKLQNEEAKFWQTFDLTWHRLQTKVQSNDVVFTVKFGINNIKFLSEDGKKVAEITVPKTLTLSQNSSSFIISNEQSSNLSRVTFRSKLTKQSYIFGTGMGWGLYEIDPIPKGLYRH